MYRIDLKSRHGFSKLRSLTQKWGDDSKFSVPLVVIKISEAFLMYHQVASAELAIHNRKFKNLHPVLINDLDTDENVLLTMNQNGAILHFDLIDDRGRLRRRDGLRKVASKTIRQEYLDYFYCIAKNVEDCVKSKHP